MSSLQNHWLTAHLAGRRQLTWASTSRMTTWDKKDRWLAILTAPTTATSDIWASSTNKVNRQFWTSCQRKSTWTWVQIIQSLPTRKVMNNFDFLWFRLSSFQLLNSQNTNIKVFGIFLRSMRISMTFLGGPGGRGRISRHRKDMIWENLEVKAKKGLKAICPSIWKGG